MRESYARDGFLQVKEFYGSAEMAMLKQHTQDIQDSPEEVGGQMMYFERSKKDGQRMLTRIEDFVRRRPSMSRYFQKPEARLVRFMEELLAPKVDKLVLFKDKINFKLPGGSEDKAHQDQQAGWGKYVHWFLTAGVCVDRATAANGCIEVASGFHKKGLLASEWKPIQDLPLPYKCIECSPGDVMFFDSYVPHRSKGNNSTNARRTILLTYNSAKDGDKLADYYGDKRIQFPPDIERPKGKSYTFQV